VSRGGASTKQSRAQAGLLGAIAALTLLIAALITGISGYVDRAVTDGLRDVLESAEPLDASLRVQTTLAEDPEGQDETVRSTADELAGDGVLRINRSLQAFPLEVLTPLAEPDRGSAVQRAVLAQYDNVDDHAHLVGGDWPNETPGDDAGAAQAALHASAAAALGLGVGSVIQLGSQDGPLDILVVGTWLPDDAAESFWFGDPLIEAGTSEGTAGPFLVDRDVLLSRSTQPSVRWTIEPIPERAAPAGLPRLATGVRSLPASLDDNPAVNVRGLVDTGALGDTLDDLAVSLAATRGVNVLPILLIVAMSLVAILQTGRLLIRARSSQTALLRARGASAAQLTHAAAREAVLLAVPSSIAGSVLAITALDLVAGGRTDWTAPLWVGGLTALTCSSVLTVGAWIDARYGTRQDRATESGRGVRAAASGTAGLTVIAAAVAIWQFRLHGSPLVPDASGRLQVDPAAITAPVLGLLATSVIGLVVFGPLALFAERVTTRSSGLGAVLAARQVGRRLRVFAVAVVLLALSAGAITLAAGYARTWADLNQAATELASGTDVRIVLPDPGPLTADSPVLDLRPYADLPGVTAASPVMTAEIDVGDQEGELVAVDSSELPQTMASPAGVLDLEQISRAITTRDAGPLLPAAAARVELDVTASAQPIEPPPDAARMQNAPRPEAAELRTQLWLLSPAGVLAAVDTEPIPIPAGGLPSAATTLHADLSPALSGARLVGIQLGAVGVSGGGALLTFDYLLSAARIESTDRSVSELDIDGYLWRALPAAVGQDLPPQLEYGAMPFEVGSTEAGGLIRLAPVESAPVGTADSGGGPEDALIAAVATVPVAVSADLARAVGVAAGDPITLHWSGSGREVTGEVAAVVPAVPGTGGEQAILADLGALNRYLFATTDSIPDPDEVWLGTATPDSVVSAFQGLDGDHGELATGAGGSTPLLVPAVRALWLGAVGCLLLALISVAAIATVLGAARRAEIPVLRAVGVSGLQQARQRAIEFLAVSAGAICFGVVGGWLIGLLTLGGLARSAVPAAVDALPAPVRLEGLPWAALLVVELVALLGIAATYGARVHRQARETTYRMDPR